MATEKEFNKLLWDAINFNPMLKRLLADPADQAKSRGFELSPKQLALLKKHKDAIVRCNALANEAKPILAGRVITIIGSDPLP